jgi:3-phenylpropionate/trans-cinnamate dioxygenase ferredoxin reductase component
VTVVEVGARALGRGVPQSLADQIVKRHRSEQVQFRFNTQVNAIEKIGDSFAVHLDDAEVLPADVIVAGVGAVPETQLAESAGLVLDNGIAVDECLFTSDPLILAAGDCCSSPSLLYGGVRIRLESWRAARDQALVAAANVLGEQRVYDAVPWFWSDQFDLTLQIAGLPGFATREVVREQPTGAAVHFGLDDSGRLVSVAALATPESFGVFKSIKLAERLIAAKAKPDPASLADPSIALPSQGPSWAITVPDLPLLISAPTAAFVKCRCFT